MRGKGSWASHAARPGMHSSSTTALACSVHVEDVLPRESRGGRAGWAQGVGVTVGGGRLQGQCVPGHTHSPSSSLAHVLHASTQPLRWSFTNCELQRLQKPPPPPPPLLLRPQAHAQKLECVFSTCLAQPSAHPSAGLVLHDSERLLAACRARAGQGRGWGRGGSRSEGRSWQDVRRAAAAQGLALLALPSLSTPPLRPPPHAACCVQPKLTQHHAQHVGLHHRHLRPPPQAACCVQPKLTQHHAQHVGLHHRHNVLRGLVGQGANTVGIRAGVAATRRGGSTGETGGRSASVLVSPSPPGPA